MAVTENCSTSTWASRPGCGQTRHLGGVTAQAAVSGRTLCLGSTDRLADRSQFSQPILDTFEGDVETPSFAFACRPAGIVRLERVDDLVKRQADSLELPGQPNPVDYVAGVVAVSGRPSHRLGHHAAPFVEPDRVHRDTRRDSDLADSQRKPLTLDMTPEFTLQA